MLFNRQKWEWKKAPGISTGEIYGRAQLNDNSSTSVVIDITKKSNFVQLDIESAWKEVLKQEPTASNFRGFCKVYNSVAAEVREKSSKYTQGY